MPDNAENLDFAKHRQESTETFLPSLGAKCLVNEQHQDLRTDEHSAAA